MQPLLGHMSSHSAAVFAGAAKTAPHGHHQNKVCENTSAAAYTAPPGRKSPAADQAAGLVFVLAVGQWVALIVVIAVMFGSSSSSVGPLRSHCTISRGRNGRENR